DAHKTIRVVSVTAAGLEAVNSGSEGVTVRQRSALECLSGAPAGIPAPRLVAEGIAADTIARLKRHGLVSIRHDRIDRDPFESSFAAQTPDTARRLTLEQQDALVRLRTLAASRAFRVALLHGVTGS